MEAAAAAAAATVVAAAAAEAATAAVTAAMAAAAAAAAGSGGGGGRGGQGSGGGGGGGGGGGDGGGTGGGGAAGDGGGTAGGGGDGGTGGAAAAATPVAAVATPAAAARASAGKSENARQPGSVSVGIAPSSQARSEQLRHAAWWLNAWPVRPPHARAVFDRRRVLLRADLLAVVVREGLLEARRPAGGHGDRVGWRRCSALSEPERVAHLATTAYKASTAPSRTRGNTGRKMICSRGSAAAVALPSPPRIVQAQHDDGGQSEDKKTEEL